MYYKSVCKTDWKANEVKTAKYMQAYVCWWEWKAMDIRLYVLSLH